MTDMTDMTVDQRKPRVLMVIFATVWITIAISIGVFGWTNTWELLIHNNVVEQPFYDMWTVKTALDTAAMGLNPQLENPSHPAGIVMNYPSVWLSIGDVFNLRNDTSFIVFTSAVVVTFLLCGVLLLREAPSLWMLSCLLSGAVFFAVERGNNDLVVFSLLFLAAAVPPFIRTIPVLAAILLKLYPVLVLPWFVRALKELPIVLVGCGAIVWYVWPEIDAVLAGNAAWNFLTYGNLSVSILVEELFGTSVSTGAVSVALVVAGILCGATLSHHCDVEPAKKSEFREQLFYFGSCLFLGTFVLGNNNVYRLIMLILCIPHILSLRNQRLSVTAMACLFLVLNSVHMQSLFKFLGDVMNVALGIVLFLVVSTMLMHQMRRDVPWLDRLVSGSLAWLPKRLRPAAPGASAESAG